MADQVAPRDREHRDVPPAALVATVGLATFALAFCASLLLGRGFVGSTLTALPIAVTGGLAVGLIAAFGVMSTLEQPNGRRRAGRAATVLTPLAALVAMLAYGVDPGTTVGRALGTGDPTSLVERRTPRAQRTIGVPAAPTAVPVAPRRPAGQVPVAPPAPPAPPAPAAPGNAPAGDPVAVAPVSPVSDPGRVAGPVAPPAAAPVAQRPSERPSEDTDRAARRRAARQLPETSGDDPVEPVDARPSGTTGTRVSPTGPTVEEPSFVAEPDLVTKAASEEPRDAKPRRTTAAKPATSDDEPAKASKPKKAKKTPPACTRAKGRPAVCRNRAR